MKTNLIKTFALCAVLSLSSVVYAQSEKTINDWAVDDTVMIKPETKHYLTGEEPSTWVYPVEHTIQQVGGKRFPEGILLHEIISWVGPNDIYPAGATKVQEQAQPQETKPQEQQPEQETKPQEQQPEQQTQPEQETQPQEQETQPEVEPLKTDSDKYKQGEDQKNDFAVRTTRMSKHHRFSIGLRGGAASLMHHAEPMNNWKVGFDGLLDLQYAYYFGAKDGKKTNHGIITGLSVGYAQSPIRNGVDTTYTVSSNDGNGDVNIQYTIQADEVKETDRQVQIEIPLMYSLQTEKGFFLNVGPRFMMPVYKFYNQTISNNANTNINAYFEDLGVTVRNEDITGALGQQDYNTKGQWAKGKMVLSVMLTAELGWEWQLNNGDAFGLGLYGNYAPYNSFKNTTNAKSLIDVTAPQGSTPASVDILSATDTYADKMNYFDGGLKLVYHFQFPAK